MTNGTSQGLFIIVAVIIFGIFVLISYLLFGDKLKTGLASIFDDSLEQVGLSSDTNDEPSSLADIDKPINEIKKEHDLDNFKFQDMNNVGFTNNNGIITSDDIVMDFENYEYLYSNLPDNFVTYDYNAMSFDYTQSSYYKTGLDETTFAEMTDLIREKGDNVTKDNIIRVLSNKNITTPFDLMTYFAKTRYNAIDTQYKGLDYDKSNTDVVYNRIMFSGGEDYIKFDGVSQTKTSNLTIPEGTTHIQIGYTLKFYGFQDIKFEFNLKAE